MSRSSLRAVLKNEIGQMSVFIALLFQLLFVLFAMVVNIGMLVHDKINLQNAVDLAAYYGAQRQAEILNEIAHLNYQIRQDYKLMAYRYNVEGTLGRNFSPRPTDDTLPPALRSNASAIKEEARKIPADYPAEVDAVPAVCISNFLWSDYLVHSDENDNLCYQRYGSALPQIPKVEIIASFVPLVNESADFTKQAQAEWKNSVTEAGPRNWAFAAQTFYAYKLAAGTRKSAIWTLRKNLVSAGFTDHDGNKVEDGIRKTLQKNLTTANLAGLATDGVQVLNGLSLGGCDGGDGSTLLPEVATAPAVMYVYMNADGGPEIAYGSNTSTLDSGELNKWDPTNTLRSIMSGEPDAKNPAASTLGFEKNPWCMAYVGVKATTKAYKPFAPFGAPITLEARGFAQPFGGRVGPWYKARWSHGSANSDGGDRVDPLTSSRFVNGSLDASDRNSRMLNYSRYPGDPLGLHSALAQGAQRKTFADYRAAAKDKRIWLKWFSKIGDVTSTGDNLAIDPDGTAGPFDGDVGPLRRAEVSAVAPDLFDATYYSIDPRFFVNYANSGSDRFSGAVTVDGGTKVREFADLGGKLGSGEFNQYDTEKQITDSLQYGFDQELKGKLFYVLQKWEHLLNSWVSNAANDYSFPADRFAKCTTAASDANNGKYMIPGKCIQGGRVGYSVRLISKSALTYEQWQVGGANESPGPLLNPPTDF